MIIYNPNDGLPIQGNHGFRPKHCFLMTRLGKEIHEDVAAVRAEVTRICDECDYTVIDANARVTGRDLLLKIWKLIAETPLSVAVVHKGIPAKTLANIYYEIGVAQALGKETVIIKCPKSKVPSDLAGTEYIEFNDEFEVQFKKFMDGLAEQATWYETLSDQLEKNPVLAIDYLKRAYLITGDESLKDRTKELLIDAEIENRAKNSVEALAASFAFD